MKHSQRAFTSLELLVGIVLFSLAMSGLLVVGKALRDHQTASVSASQRNAYATFQSEVAMQGINPSLVGNPLAAAINQSGTPGLSVALGPNTPLTIQRQATAAFEVGATSSPTSAQRSLGGSARIDAIQYAVVGGGGQSGGADRARGNGTGVGRGTGFGFAVETTGPAAVVHAIPLAPPIFNAYFNQSSGNDLTNAPFPLNQIATLPMTNPPGTTYRYTTNGSMPTASSPLWDNNPGWTPATFPGQVTLAAFNTDPQYGTSPAVSTSLYMTLVLNYSRADNRDPSAQYGFALSDLTNPSVTGIVLGTNVDAYGVPVAVQYSVDGSDPASKGTAYNRPFVPPQAQFSPNVTLQAVATSTDPRIHPASVFKQTLSTNPAPLTPPSFVTSNAAPLNPGDSVVISVGSSGSPRTEVNNGIPSNNSSANLSFPLN